jgi:hypothetical protein
MFFFQNLFKLPSKQLLATGNNYFLHILYKIKPVRKLIPKF